MLRILAQSNHNVSELSFDTVSLTTGINFMMLEQPCDEYDYFMSILKRPKFSHLDLPLYVGELGHIAGREKPVEISVVLLAKQEIGSMSASRPHSIPALWARQYI